MKRMILSVFILSNSMSFAQRQDSIGTRSIDEVVIKGLQKKDSEYSNKMPLKYLEDSQVYSSIDKSVLENQLLFSMEDALRNISGAQKMSGGVKIGKGGTYINLRGFTTAGSLRNGLAAHTDAVDAINIERIEVLKGPSATLFGSNITSYGGVVNRISKKPFKTFNGTISVAIGSYNYYRIQSDINVPLTLNKKLLFRLNTAYTNQGTFNKTNANNSINAFSPSLRYQPTENLEINAEFEIFETSAYPDTQFFIFFPSSQIGGNRIDKLEKLGYNYKETYAGDGLKITSKINNFFGQINYKITPSIKSSTSISFSHSYLDGFSNFFYFAPKSIETLNTNDTEVGIIRDNQYIKYAKKTYFQLQHNLNFGFNIGYVRSRMVIGFDYMNMNDDQISMSNNFGWTPFNFKDYSNMNAQTLSAIYNNLQSQANFENIYVVPGKKDNYSGYISNIITPIKGLNILTSIRYENTHFKGGKIGPNNTLIPYTQGAWSPKLGIVYQLIPDKISVFGNYQTSFKSNGYYISDKESNRKLAAPERAKQIEIGLKTDLLKGTISATLSYYNIKVKNTILNTNEFVPNTTNPVESQAGLLTSQGIELETSLYLLRGLYINTGLSYNDMKYIESSTDLNGRRPGTASSPWLINVNASYQFLNAGLKGIGIGIGGNYASDNKIVNSTNLGTFTLPSYIVLNINAFYEAKKFRIGIKVDNFLNAHYWNAHLAATPQTLANIVGNFTYKF